MLTMTSFWITAPYYFYNSIRPGRVTGGSKVIDIDNLNTPLKSHTNSITPIKNGNIFLKG